MSLYDHRKIEKKWQDRWADSGIFRSDEDASRRKCYVLDMFPYPSGDGLHVGHPEGYTATDIISRKRRMEDWNVLHPMGFDAFGLPAENFAIKKGVHPRESTNRNIDNFRRQLKSLGFSYDWTREISTCDPAYYRWTQWLFLFLYRHGLAYKGTAPVNWCDSCRTVLANEQVEDGACERCKNPVIQKNLEQWFFRVTDYADRLLEDLDRLDWPERIKTVQSNWIGRSEGSEIAFQGDLPDAPATPEGEGEPADRQFEIKVFTTRPDTLFGVTYVVLAPEHPLTLEICSEEQRGTVSDYVQAARAKSELQRVGTEQDKTGVSLGVSVRHPLTGREIPVWTADYALASYGTGAVMGVPAHDQRDFEFANKYGLPIIQVIAPQVEPGRPVELEEAYVDRGYLVNSEDFDGLDSEEAKGKIVEALSERGSGQAAVKYHLRDWLVSRQRYWGAPIPIVYCEACGEVPVPEEDLPVLLPDDVDFRPTGESPLSRSKSFHDVRCPKCGGTDCRRESDTMDTFVDSSWYFLRYPSPNYGDKPFSSHAVEYWCPIDLYVGGAEHAVLHLMYARFFTKVLADHGLLGFDEPFLTLKNPGLIMGEDGQKMSKSRGNVINPDDVVGQYGADTFRLYEMFMGEFEDAKPWDTKGIVGCRRFLDRIWLETHNLVHEERDACSDSLTAALHRTVKKVTEDIEAFKFNTAIAAMMTLLNDWQKDGGGDRAFAETFLRLLSPFAPHLADELWELLGHKSSVALSRWPEYDPKLIVEKEVEVVVQVNGKVRDRFTAATGTDDEALKAQALESANVKRHLEGRTVRKVLVIEGRLVNIVAS